jgi:hypothetical protein
MADYEVGRGRPPKHSQFKPGVSGNPPGRRKQQPADLATMIVSVLNAPIQHQENGRKRTTSGRELNLRMLVQRAVRGNVDAARAVLRSRIQTERNRSGLSRVEIEDWLPEYEGQTAEEKTRDFAQRRNAASIEWWAQLSKSQPKPRD